MSEPQSLRGAKRRSDAAGVVARPAGPWQPPIELRLLATPQIWTANLRGLRQCCARNASRIATRRRRSRLLVTFHDGFADDDHLDLPAALRGHRGCGDRPQEDRCLLRRW